MTNTTLRLLNIAVWVVQLLLSANFLMIGFMKVTMPIEILSIKFEWVNHVLPGLVRFIGAMEFLGGLGLLLPSVLKIMPVLTPWAATGILTTMVLAMLFHISIGQSNVIGVNIEICLLAQFVAWGRLKKVPILPRDISDDVVLFL